MAMRVEGITQIRQIMAEVGDFFDDFLRFLTMAIRVVNDIPSGWRGHSGTGELAGGQDLGC